MTYDMVCLCGASLHINSDAMDDRSWMFVDRFANAHVKCGFIMPAYEDQPETTKNLNIKLKDV